MSRSPGSPSRLPGGESPGGSRRVLISVAEPSADLHGAALIRKVRDIQPDIDFVGLGGPRMRQAGCRVIADLTPHASMLSGIFRLVHRGWTSLRRLKQLADTEKIDLCVLIDSPVLNLPLARQAKRRGIPVLYYIAPQTWAWAEYRLAKLRRRADRLAVILPFEESYFRKHGFEADFVGHPLMDELLARKVDPGEVARLREGASPVIALLPGSRRQVVREVLPGQLEVCRQIARRFPLARFVVSVAGEPVQELIESYLAGAGVPVQSLRDRNGELLSAADLVLVASGTATLEVAYYRKPMIVMYNHSRWLYRLLGPWLIRTPHLSLPNIIAGHPIVPEYMPYYRSPDPIAARAIELLSTPHSLARMTEALDRMMTPLDCGGASANAARIVLEILNAKPDPGGPVNPPHAKPTIEKAGQPTD